MAAFCELKITLFLVLLNSIFTQAELPEKILCADSKCKAPLSRVQSRFSYEAPDPFHLSFRQYDVIQVFAKDVDESGLWTGELLMKPGKIGLFKKELVKELVVFNKRPGEHVDTVGFYTVRGSQEVQDILKRQSEEANQQAEQNGTNEGGTELEPDGGGTGFFGDEVEEIEDDYEEEEEDDFYDDEDEDDDDDWSYYDRKYVEVEEEDFLEELMDARGAEERIVKTQESKPVAREAKVASHGEDQDKGDLEETEKSNFDGPIENMPPQDRLEIAQKVQELIKETKKTERQKEVLAAKDPPGGPLRGETMNMEEAENIQEEEALMKEREKKEDKMQTEETVSINTEDTSTLQNHETTDNTQHQNSEDIVENAHESEKKTEDFKEDKTDGNQVITEDEKEDVRHEDPNGNDDGHLEKDEDLPFTGQNEVSSDHHEELPSPTLTDLEKEELVDLELSGNEEDKSSDSTTHHEDTASEQQRNVQVVVENAEDDEAEEEKEADDSKSEEEVIKEENGHPEPADTEAEATETEEQAEVQDESKDTESTQGSEHPAGESSDDEPAQTESTESEKQEDRGEDDSKEEGKDFKNDDAQESIKEPVTEESKEQEEEKHHEEIRSDPSIEVIDGTTLYLDDLEPTPLPHDPTNEVKTEQSTPQEEQGDVFKMQASNVVNMDETGDDGFASPPSTFSIKSEEDIDPVAYRNILNKLHSHPQLKDKEGAIQQEMLKILRDPELKKNLLVKPQSQNKNILSNFRSNPKPAEDIITMDQHQEEAQEKIQEEAQEKTQEEAQNEEVQSVENPTSTEIVNDKLSLDSLPEAGSSPPVGPDSEEGKPQIPIMPPKVDMSIVEGEVVDPLALLQTEGGLSNQPPSPSTPSGMPQDGDDIAKIVLAMSSQDSTNGGEELIPSIPVDDAHDYDPATSTPPLGSAQGPDKDEGSDPAQLALQQDPAMAIILNSPSTNQQESTPPPSADTQDSPQEAPATDSIETPESTEDSSAVQSNDTEVPLLPSIESSLPPAVDVNLNIPKEVGSSYGEPGFRSSTRFPLQVEEDLDGNVENDSLDNNEEEDYVGEESPEVPTGEEEVVDEQPEASEQPESDVHIVVTESQNDIFIDEVTHHQVYTREENEVDDGVTVEEERDEQIEDEQEQVAPGAGGEDWLAEMMRNLDPALKVLNNSIFTPILQMFPTQFQDAVQQPDFLGISWMAIIIFEASTLCFFLLIVCCWNCSSRRSRSLQQNLSREVEVLTAQKAEVLDTLDMTNAQFQKQNLEYFELKSSTEQTGQDKSKIEKKFRELDQLTKEQKQEMEKIKAALKKKNSEQEASQQKIKSLENQAKKSQSSITDLKANISDLEGKVYAGEEECSHLTHKITSLEEYNQQVTDSKERLETELTGTNERVSELTEQIQLMTGEKKDIEDSLSFKDNEIEVLKDCLLQLKGLENIQKEGPEVDSEAKIQQLLDLTRVNAKLSLVSKEREELQDRLDQEVRAGRELEAKVGSLHQEMEALRQEHTKAKSGLDEAQTKMEVLQEYFKNKEVDLQRKLGREEALKIHTEDQLTSLNEKAVSAEVDLNNYRQQIADLKAELDKSERTYRSQVNAHEKKTHEHWLSSRTAERELQEAKREAATLRHRLTELEGRRATSENAPLVKPQAAAPSPMRVVSPSFRPGDRISRGSRRGPSRNSLIETESPSPPTIDPGTGSRLSPGMHPPPLHPDDFPPHPMHPDMGPSPYGREPLPHPDFGYGPPHGDFPPDFRPHPDDMDFGPRGPPPPDFRPMHGFPPPERGEFDHHGPPPGFDPRFGPPPPHHDMDPRGPPPPMHGPGPYPGEGPPPFDRRGPPPHPGMRPMSGSGQMMPPDPMGGPRTSSPMPPPGPQGVGPRGPPSRPPPNMQA